MEFLPHLNQMTDEEVRGRGCPYVGMGVTVTMSGFLNLWSFTVIEVRHEGREIVVQRDGALSHKPSYFDKNRFVQGNYSFYKKPNGATLVLRRRKAGRHYTWNGLGPNKGLRTLDLGQRLEHSHTAHDMFDGEKDLS